MEYRGCLTQGVMLAVVFAFLSFLAGGVGQAQESDPGFSPASGEARVIAQGVVALPEGDAVWRTVRTRALTREEAPFEARPLGFVLATTGPLLLVDQTSGEQVRLGIGEAALVPPGTVQQRASLGPQPVSYLSIELVPVDAPPPGDSAIVLQPGQPFPAPPGLHDVDLLIDTVRADETFLVPDSGQKNVILVTDGSALAGRPGSEAVVLLPGEAASFSGELEVGAAEDSWETGTTFVVAMIGPEVPAVATAEPTAAVTEPAARDGGTGSITVQVYTCPPGMTAETLNAAACAPAAGDFDVTLSGTALDGPLTAADAERSGEALVWSALPFGEYVIAEAVLPSGYDDYLLVARETAGNPVTGYRVTLGAAEPELAIRIYNFASA